MGKSGEIQIKPQSLNFKMIIKEEEKSKEEGRREGRQDGCEISRPDASIQWL